MPNAMENAKCRNADLLAPVRAPAPLRAACPSPAPRRRATSLFLRVY